KSKGDFLDYYLDHMKAADGAAGRRLIDYLDLHWYPEAKGNNIRITNGPPDDVTDPVVAARLQAPRSLWDAGYVESSWITSCCNLGPIDLLPRLRDKIAAHYPGTKLAFTEYNYG